MSWGAHAKTQRPSTAICQKIEINTWLYVCIYAASKVIEGPLMRAPFSALLVGAPAAAPPKAPPAAHAAEAANRGPGSQMVRPGGGLLEVIEAMAMFLAIFFGGGLAD